MTKETSEERLRRILAMVPWVAAHDGPKVDVVCRRFGCTIEELTADLKLLYMCGLYPYTPELLIDATIRRGRVWIEYADYFQRPLRLTPAEGLALVAAASTLLATTGTDPQGPLARGLAKLAAVLGGNAARVDVALGRADPEILAGMRTAARDGRQVDIDYYSFSRDVRAWRRIEPAGVFTSAGEWYVSAFCHTANDERTFRVDRVIELRTTGLARRAPPAPSAPALFRRAPEGGEIVLDLRADGQWVADQYPVSRRETCADGTLRVTLAVTEWAWLDRLVLRLGPNATIVSAPATWPGRAAAARRVLERYAHDAQRSLDGESGTAG